MISFTDQSSEEIRNSWGVIFSRFGYDEKINAIRELYPERRSLYISYKDIAEYSNDFADSLLNSPETYLTLGQEVITADWPPFKRSDMKRVNIRLTELPENEIRVDIRQIRAQHIGKLISITGIIRKNTEVLPRLQNAAFQCSQCSHVNMAPQVRGRVEEPVVCEQCDGEKPKVRFKLLPNESGFVDIEKIEIQENPETIEGGAQPQRITVIVEDDLTGNLFPGDRVTVQGILVSEQKKTGNVPLTEFNIYVFANNYYKDNREIGDVEIGPEDEREIIALSKLPDIYDQFVQSIAPSIYNYEVIKRALVLQMFGGLRKNMKDGTAMRGDIHIFLIGDPGTAKSQLLRYMSEISPRGVFAFGKGSSAAGLTAAAVRDDFGEGRWTLEAGVLVMANDGLAAIDELDKMEPGDVSSMHEAMEQQSFHYDSEIVVDGVPVRIGEFVDGLISANRAKVRYGHDCEILEISHHRVLSSDLTGILPEDMVQISRHTAPGRLLRIFLEGGRNVCITDNHPVWVLKDGKVCNIPAGTVEPGDLIPASEGPDSDTAASTWNRINENINRGSATTLEIASEYLDSVDFIPVSKVESEAYSRKWVYDVGVRRTRTLVVGGVVIHNSITISKAGIMASLKSRCSVLAAGNPKFGRYDPSLMLIDQTWLPLPLLSRFDVIFRVVDEPQVSKDTKLADHILNAHRVGEQYRKGELEKKDSDEQIEGDVNYVPRIPKKTIRKYVAYAKSRVFPVMTQEAIDKIRNYYVKVRNNSNERMKITARQLESIIRLSEANARVRLSNTVTASDADQAIAIIKHYLSEAATDSEGKVDADIINVGISNKQRGEMEQIFMMIKTLCSRDQKDGVADAGELEQEAKSKGIGELKVRSIVDKLKAQGMIYETSSGKLKAVT
ncbi:MAG: AAA family ATPase [Candidatus Thermoplasmatota archaeon]|jgi:replicative DNA helicase Mcm|nr:AAA family ATPase [Candidatus Thermoplasmatota archaeon]MCL5793739.1 AAA family ATPase [Candidatus Thermoplasmatota archaeon]